MIEYLPKWYQIDELIELVHFVGVNRPGYQCRDRLSYYIWWMFPEMFISSSTDSRKAK